MSGGRLNLVLEGERRYAVEISAGDQTWHASLEIDPAGHVGFGAWQPPDPPAWLCQAATAVMRAEWRARQFPDAPPWPRRITRWRRGPDDV